VQARGEERIAMLDCGGVFVPKTVTQVHEIAQKKGEATHQTCILINHS